ncbi:MAG: nucleotide exchange factor GrpE, partial [Anaerolineae bacterium]|nr:nucleotide exchange factor GrpE [Anaerolineae bacterium]
MYNRYPYRFGPPAAPRRSSRSQRIPVRQVVNGEPYAHPEPDVRSARAEQVRQAAPDDDRATMNKPVDPTLGNDQAEPAFQTENGPGSTEPVADNIDWKQKALQLQAEMDNFRKRQSRRADDAIVRERERLLNHVLPVAHNLGRALAHADQPQNDSGSLY